MLTCPNCLKRYKSLSRHLYSSTCIRTKSKTVPHKKKSMMKHKCVPTDGISNSFMQVCANEDDNNVFCNVDSDITMKENEVEINEKVCINEYDYSKIVNENTEAQQMLNENNHLILLYEKLKRNTTIELDPNYHVWIELLLILQEINAPLNAFEKIMSWATQSKSNGYKFTNSYPSRKLLLKQLNDIVCTKDLKPIIKEVTLSDKKTTMVTTFDFEQMCFSLLTDQSIMTDENFTFVDDDPRIFERRDNTTISCIEDGEIFQNTAKVICKQSDDFCLGIKLFIDATHTDVHSNWVLDPVMFTFTFLKNNITRKHNAWRPIGFINNQGQMSTAESQQIKPKSKLQDFHTQLDIILESVRKCQERGGFKWNLKHKSNLYPTRMFPIIILIVGDAQGNHKLCGMYNSFYGTSRVNHSCDCPWIETDDVNVKCNFMPHGYIKMLSQKKNDEALNAISQHNIVNAFDKIILGNHPAGLNALMPAEILHQMFLGVVEYALSGFVNLYSKKGLSRLDRYGRNIYFFSNHNSDRSIPNLSCQYGFTSLTRQKGSDRVGLCLTILLCLSSEVADFIGEQCKKSPTTRIRNMFRSLFQDLLLYMEWLSQPSYKLSNLQEYIVKIKSLMTKMKLLVRRENNKGLKVGKFHEMLHVIRDIELFGPPCGFDGRPGESSHKDTKKCAVKTQRRKNKFEYQTGYRIYENLMISKAASLILPPKNKTKTNVDTWNDDSINIVTSTSHYFIYKTDDGRIIQNLLNSINSNVELIELHQRVSEYIYNHLSTNNVTGCIQCRTFIRIDKDLLIRSTPSYNKANGCWYDWVWINWEYDNGSITVVPAQVYSIIDLRLIDVGKTSLKPGFYLCIRSISKVPSPKWINSKIIYAGSFETNHTGKEVFRLVHIENIVKACYAIPDLDTLDYTKKEISNWLFVATKEEWHKLF